MAKDHGSSVDTPGASETGGKDSTVIAEIDGIGRTEAVRIV
jgi:hypothetical protein